MEDWNDWITSLNLIAGDKSEAKQYLNDINKKLPVEHSKAS